jgi:ppGpp synthetase/RelA/SpoT-type nucleotidyltranferase
MTDREQALLERWRGEEPLYSAWGRFVGVRLSEVLQSRLAPTALEVFLRIPIKSRVKETESLLQKAFYRNKRYKDPYEEIEDKVGLRFVVLLSDDIRLIEDAIVSETDCWTAKKARDFIEERDARPYEFDYQSLHYIVRSSRPFVFEGTKIPQDLPCEIQIRTLLQHAYSELTHSTIYKPSVTATPAMKRAAAKSMALIEATDDYFRHVDQAIQAAVATDRKLLEFLSRRYEELVGTPAADSPLNSLLIDHYKRFAAAEFQADFDRWVGSKMYVADFVRERAPNVALYRAPAVLLVYYSVAKARRLAREDSPLRDDELEPIYSDLGLALYG